MKKSLSLISILFFSLLLISCKSRNKKQAEAQPKNTTTTKAQVVEKKATPSDTKAVTDTNKVIKTGEKTGEINSSSSIKKDTTGTNVKAIPVNHNSANQKKLDSIKKAKAKLKK